MAGWLKNELREFTNDTLSDSALARTGLFDQGYVRSKLDAHYSGREKNNKIIFSLLMFVLWHEQAGADS